MHRTRSNGSSAEHVAQLGTFRECLHQVLPIESLLRDELRASAQEATSTLSSWSCMIAFVF